jgi:hypothetical protein
MPRNYAVRGWLTALCLCLDQTYAGENVGVDDGKSSGKILD